MGRQRIEFVEVSRSRQALPPKVEDEALLLRVAALILITHRDRAASSGFFSTLLSEF